MTLNSIFCHEGGVGAALINDALIALEMKTKVALTAVVASVAFITGTDDDAALVVTGAMSTTRGVGAA